jgi:hypothetical protein
MDSDANNVFEKSRRPVVETYVFLTVKWLLFSVDPKFFVATPRELHNQMFEF